MSALHIEQLSVDLGGEHILRDVSLRVDDGAFAVIVGPSGCGKSTLLRAIAGLERPSAGRVAVDDEILSDNSVFVPPMRRRIGWVPQTASLLPHLNAAQNVAFGSLAKRGRAQRVAELLAMVGLDGLGDRFPDQLSGGQAQRVALARALAADPRVLLLDEPFAALDPGLRSELRDEVRATLDGLGITAVLVTHDQTEALGVAETVLIMKDGASVQQGTPREVYERPRSLWVAAFLGEANVVSAVARGRVATSPLGDVRLLEPADGPVDVLIRPEHIAIAADGVPARVSRVRYAGHDLLLDVDAGGLPPLRVRVAATVDVGIGDVIRIGLTGKGLPFTPNGQPFGRTRANAVGVE